jgi:hypothetical protein
VQKILLALGARAPAKVPNSIAASKRHTLGTGRTVSFIAKLTAVGGTRKRASAQTRVPGSRRRQQPLSLAARVLTQSQILRAMVL